MKTHSLNPFLKGLAMLLLTFLGALPVLKGQSEEAPKIFKISIELKGKEVILECETGCNWKQLTYTPKGTQAQAIDEYGLTEPGKAKSEKSPDSADFLFTISKVNKTFTLHGKEGTNWVTLTFETRGKGKAWLSESGVNTTMR